MQYAEFPILSLIIFSPVLGIALAGVFRDASDGIPAKVAALSSSLLTFLLSLYLWFHFDASEEGLQLVSVPAGFHNSILNTSWDWTG